MAKTVINVGSSANDGTGDPLRTAMQSTNSNINEIYSLFGDGTTLAISGDATVSSGALTIANDAVENAMVADDAIDSPQIADGAVDTVHIADDNVTFAKIEDRYTARSTTGSTSGTISIDWSAATTFEFTASLTGATTLNFTNFKQGQVIGIYGLTAAQTITLDSDAATSETFNRIGTSEYDGTGTNFLQVACVDDSATAVFNYSVITYTADTTP